MYSSTYDAYITLTMMSLLSAYAFIMFIILAKVISGKLTNWESYPFIPNFIQLMVHDLWFKVLKEDKQDGQLLLWLTPIAIIVLSSVWVISVPLIAYGLYKYMCPYICSSSSE